MNIKSPYRLEIWDERYIVENNIGRWEEILIDELSSDTSEFYGRAQNINFVPNIYGELKLSFSIDRIIINPYTGEKEDNRLAQYIKNEAKIKLLHKNKWYDFIIKDIQESHNNTLTLTCTCQQLSVNELGKIGYEQVFSLESENGSAIQEAGAFMEQALQGTDWRYLEAGTPNTPAASYRVDLVEYNRSPCYRKELTSDITAHKYYFTSGGDLVETDEVTLRAGTYIFVPYISVNVDNDIFCYPSDTSIPYELDLDNGVIDKNKLVYISQASGLDSVKGICVSYFMDTPHKNKDSDFINHVDYTVADNSIKEYCNKCEYVDDDNNTHEAYYRTITRNTFDANYMQTPDYDPNGSTPNIPAFRAIADEYLLADTPIKVFLPLYSGTEQMYAFVRLREPLPTSCPVDFKYNTANHRWYICMPKSNANNYWREAILYEEQPNRPLVNVKILNCAYKVYYKKLYTINGATDYTEYTRLSSWPVGTNDEWYETIVSKYADASTTVGSVVQYFEYDKEHDLVNILGYSQLKDLTSKEFYVATQNGTYGFNVKTGKYVLGAYTEDNRYSKYVADDLYTYNMRRTIEVEKSNVFNITQTIAETFNVWCRYIIEYNPETGEILTEPLYDKTGNVIGTRRKKWITLVSNYGKDNDVGFTYGLNATSIQRKVSTASMATKIYVENCENDVSEDGIVAIAYSPLNVSGENFLLNFDYYLQVGIIDRDKMFKDLYNYGADSELSKDALEVECYLEHDGDQDQDDYPGYLLLLGLLNHKYDNITRTILGTGEDSLTNKLIQARALYNAYNVAVSSSGSALTLTSDEYPTLESRRDKDRAERTRYETEVSELSELIKEQTNILQNIVERKKELHSLFGNKYSRFIQEGNWQDDSYVKHDDYYNDALKVASDAARPTVEYSIAVTDLSVLPGYELFDYEVGDITWIEDVDYFGYDTYGAPKHEPVVVKEINYSLDDPTRTTITIANKSSDFEDLFQKLSATVQSYNFNEQIFNRAINLTPAGALTYASLQQSFNKNKDLTLIDNDVVTTDNEGVTVKNASDPNNIVKIVSGGIVLSKDGGQTYTTGIYAGELNTELIKTGRILTESLSIGDDFGNDPLPSSQQSSENSRVDIGKGNIYIQRKTSQGYDTVFHVDASGNLLLSGSIIGGQDDLTKPPKYYFGVDNLKQEAYIGSKYVPTSDTSRVGTKTYYRLVDIPSSTSGIPAGYISKATYDAMSTNSKQEYSVNIDYQYVKTSRYIATEDKAKQSGKTYYTYDSATGTYTQFTGTAFEENVSYYELKSGMYVAEAGDSGTKYYKGYKYQVYDGDLTSSETYYVISPGASGGKKDWRILVGNSQDNHAFGVDANGNLYASQVYLSKNIYADGGIFNNVIIKDTCTVAGKAIQGTIDGSKTTIDLGAGGELSSNGGTIGTGWNKISINKNGTLNIPSAGYASSAYRATTADTATQAGTAVRCRVNGADSFLQSTPLQVRSPSGWSGTLNIVHT